MKTALAAAAGVLVGASAYHFDDGSAVSPYSLAIVGVLLFVAAILAPRNQRP